MCSQTVCRYCMQQHCMQPIWFPLKKSPKNLAKVSDRIKCLNTRSCIQFPISLYKPVYSYSGGGKTGPGCVGEAQAGSLDIPARVHPAAV